MLEKTVGPLVIDLEQAEFMDSSVLAVLIGIQKGARQKEIRLVVVKPAGSCREIFSLTSTDRLFDFYDSAEDALQS